MFVKANKKGKVMVRVDDFDTWAIDSTLSKIIYPLLVKFKELNNGFPWNLTEKTWDETLDKMILAFKLLSDETIYDFFYDEEHPLFQDKDEVARIRLDIETGLNLFAKHYQDLWW